MKLLRLVFTTMFGLLYAMAFAAVSRGTVRVCTPVGYEVVDKGTATESMVAGDLVKNGASGWVKCPAGATEADGIALLIDKKAAIHADPSFDITAKVTEKLNASGK